MHQEAIAAEARIREHVRLTPVGSSQIPGGNVLLKHENFQRTGSFKLRGAFNRLLVMPDSERSLGVVAASTGNHGAAVACAARELGTTATIFAPTIADSSKLRNITGYGGTIIQEGDDCVIAEQAARDFAREHGLVYVSPYNDPAVVAGQATLGVELDRQLEDFDAVFIALGGGGLLGGVGGYLKACRPDVEMVACSPANSCVMHESIDAGRILDLPSLPTLSDGTAGGVEADSVTFELCREVIDHRILVSEAQIAEAMRMLLIDHHTMVEGAAAVTLAAYLAEAERYRDRRVVLVLCGANASQSVLRDVLGSDG
ncbi:MAG: threonine/serine dehydratase [Phycisphaerales bacterium]|nr:threonine/serine dehydratase [Phycisphaerales bacterium]